MTSYKTSLKFTESRLTDCFLLLAIVSEILYYVLHIHFLLDVCRNIECVDLMIGVSCEVNARDKLGRTPLHYAASTAQYQCVLSLVANAADLTAVDKLDRTPLHYAAAADGDAKLA